MAERIGLTNSTEMPPENTGWEQGGKFKPGQSGNPAGRPRGALNKTTLAVQALLYGEAEELTRKAVEMAKGGDTTAMRLCLERILPPRRDVSVNIDLPVIQNLDGAIAAQNAILSAVSQGDITPAEASSLASIVDQLIRAYETQVIEAKLNELEARLDQGKK
jgi:hypothetical protein